jgi:NAD(P)-dependent dehydrogenase (short-subunit alcohol dehydrogenase family)
MNSNSTNALTFSSGLQTEFAELSGDWNPMHMSSVAARRTQAGSAVVHGIHVVLSLLDSFAPSSLDLALPSKLAARFLKPVYVQDTVTILRKNGASNELQLQALVDGTTMVDLRVFPGDFYGPRENSNSLVTDDSVVCRGLSLAEMARSSGTVNPVATPDKIRERFPNAVRWLGVGRIAAMLCLSRLVGMECPGLHSLFSAFTIELPVACTPQSLQYEVASVDDRFRRLTIFVNGLGVRGKVEAFARHPPSVQLPISELSKLVNPDEFAGQRALIVGGSRGLGELTAKLFAAGGGNPIVTYVVGRDDAERVIAEIRQWGGDCSMLKYDVRASSFEQLQLLATPITHAYYYATCQIFRRRTTKFDSAVLEEFLEFYVRGFYELCLALCEFSGRGISAFCPSSTAIVERPLGMTEYAMAKAAAEVLCDDLNQSWPGMHITSVRLPRLLTDQTATMVPTENVDPVDVILPIVRKVQATKI